MRRLWVLSLSVLALACGDDDVRPIPDAGSDAPSTDDAGPDAFVPPTCDEDATLGETCTTAADCNDGCTCNGIELCVEGACVAGEDPCDDEVECTIDGCDEDADVCVYEADPTSCQDGNACNGEERCVPELGCRPGPRLSCTDGDACTIGACDPVEGCTYVVRDVDGDGFADDRCGGDDCNDDPGIGANIRPDATEVCDNDFDDNCNGLVDYRESTCLGINDRCDSAEPLPGPGIYTRTTRGLTQDHSLGCRAVGLDAVFTFTLPTPQDVAITVDGDAGTSAVAIRPLADCASATAETWCAASASGSSDSSLVARDVPAGEYAIVVSTSVPTNYVLTLAFADPTELQPVDVCNEGTLDVSLGGTFTGFFNDVFHDYALDCRTTTSSFPDAVYRLEIDSPKDVTLRARSLVGASRQTTYLSLVRDCAQTSSSLACTNNRTADASIARRGLEPGVYWVVLETSASTTTNVVSWQLDVTVVDALPRNEGDACSSAVDVTDATATIPLPMVELDYGTSCGGALATFRDASFFFTLTEPRDVTLTTSSPTRQYVSVATACGDRGAEIACDNSTGTLEQRLLALDAGTYFVTLATTSATGDVTVSAMTSEPTFPPDNDVCADAAPLAPSATFMGNLRAADDDVVACGPASSLDTFHALTLAERSNVTVVARRADGAVEPLYVALRPVSCGAPTADLACTSGTPALLNRTLDAGTYHLVVESLPSFAGPYVLDVFTSAP